MAIFDRLEPTEPMPEFPYELIRVKGAEAVAKCLSWRKEWRGSFTPVILGTKDDFTLLTDVWDETETAPEQVMQRSKSVDLQKWFAQRIEDEEMWHTKTAAESDFQKIHDTLSGKVHPWVYVAKIPTAIPYEVPAYLKLGGWNACPGAEEHVAVWRYWQEKYGAEILCVTGAVIEATVTRPPLEKDECYVLAREQFSYCEDIVTQGVGSIDALADILRGGKSWYFWWD